MSEKKPSKLLRVRDAAEVLGISVSKMNDLYCGGKIPHVRVDRSVRFEANALKEYIEANTSTCGQPR
jgi:excisionase family DNA binding protein